MRQRYDARSKWLIATCADSILKLAGITGVESWVALAAEQVQSRQLPDGLLEVKLAGRDEPVLFLIEINTYPENRVEEELLEDLLMMYLNRGVVPEIVTIVLCQRGQLAIPATASRTSPNGGTSFPARWRVVEIWNVPAEPITSEINPGLILWIPLMKTSVPPPLLLQQCREIIDTVADKTRFENLLVVTDVLAGLRYDKEVLSKFFRKGADMIESPVLEEYSERRAIRERQKFILEVLADRFATVPENIATGIPTINEESRLRLLTKAAAICQSIDQFQSTLHATL